MILFLRRIQVISSSKYLYVLQDGYSSCVLTIYIKCPRFINFKLFAAWKTNQSGQILSWKQAQFTNPQWQSNLRENTSILPYLSLIYWIRSHFFLSRFAFKHAWPHAMIWQPDKKTKTTKWNVEETDGSTMFTNLPLGNMLSLASRTYLRGL